MSGARCLVLYKAMPSVFACLETAIESLKADVPVRQLILIVFSYLHLHLFFHTCISICI